MSTDQAMPTPEATRTSGLETVITEGIHLVSNRYTRGQLDLFLGRKDEGAPVYTCRYIDGTGFVEQHWLLSPVEDKFFVFRNIGTGTVLEFEANGNDYKRLECKSRREGDPKQHWSITLEQGNHYSIRNAHFPDKVLEVYLKGKGIDDDIDVGSRKYIRGLRDQQWALERRSRTVSELASLAGECPVLGETEITWPSSDVSGFGVIKDHWRDHLVKKSGLLREVSRPALFDDKDFVLKMRDAVRSWGAQLIKVEGYGILFGVVCGSADVGSNAYNWYLTDDLCEIVFLDPSTGRQYTAKGLQKKGFRAQWAIC